MTVNQNEKSAQAKLNQDRKKLVQSKKRSNSEGKEKEQTNEHHPDQGYLIDYRG